MQVNCMKIMVANKSKCSNSSHSDPSNLNALLVDTGSRESTVASNTKVTETTTVKGFQSYSKCKYRRT